VRQEIIVPPEESARADSGSFAAFAGVIKAKQTALGKAPDEQLIEGTASHEVGIKLDQVFIRERHGSLLAQWFCGSWTT
jgi:hypothetical protein